MTQFVITEKVFLSSCLRKCLNGMFITWSSDWKMLVQFGGKNTTFTFFRYLVLWMNSTLVSKSKIFMFWELILASNALK
jgi:hypothetical protein